MDISDLAEHIQKIRNQRIADAIEEIDQSLESLLDEFQAMPLKRLCPGLLRLVRDAISVIGDKEFTPVDIREMLRTSYPMGTASKRAALSSTLMRLVNKHNELILVKKGSGSSPSIYKRSAPLEAKP